MPWFNSSPPSAAYMNCVDIGSDNGLSPRRRQGIIWTNAGILWIAPLKTNIRWNFMPQSHPTTVPVRFLTPVRFLARKAEWSTRRNFTPRVVIMVTSGYGPRTAWHGCTLMFWSNNSHDLHGPRAVPVRASYRPRTGISNVLHILRDPYGARAGPARVPYGALTGT